MESKAPAPRLVFDNEPFKAGKAATCDDCLQPVVEGTIMRRTVATKMIQLTSLDNREISLDDSMNVCPSCVVLNDLRRGPRDSRNVKEVIATSKAHYKDLIKAKQKVRKTKNVLPNEE